MGGKYLTTFAVSAGLPIAACSAWKKQSQVQFQEHCSKLCSRVPYSLCQRVPFLICISKRRKGERKKCKQSLHGQITGLLLPLKRGKKRRKKLTLLLKPFPLVMSLVLKLEAILSVLPTLSTDTGLILAAH